MQAQNRYMKILQWAIVVAIFIFLGRMVWQNWVQVREASFAFRPIPLILSVLIFAFSYFIQLWAWYLITSKLGIALPFWETLASWFYSQLGKYLPGKVWLLLGRFHLYDSKGKSKKAVSIALYFETITMMVAAGIVFLAGYLFFEETKSYSSSKPIEWLLFPFFMAFVFLHPRLLVILLNWTLGLFKKEPVSLSISYPEILWILFISLLSWCVGGVGFYLFVYSLFPVSLQSVLFLTGALAFSSTLGLIALFAPSGLGVREGVLVYLLSSIMPAPVAVVISILTRLWTTFIEIGLIGMVYITIKLRQGLEREDQHVKI